MRQVVQEIKNIRVCKEEAAVPAAFGVEASDGAPRILTFTLWSVEGYFLGAFATLLQACDFAKATADGPFDAAANEGISRLLRLADIGDPSSDLAITGRAGEVLQTVPDFDVAIECIKADIAKASMDRGSPALGPAKGMR